MVDIKIGRGIISSHRFNLPLEAFLDMSKAFKMALLPSNTDEEIDTILTDLYNTVNHDRSEGTKSEVAPTKSKSAKSASRKSK